MNSNTSQNKARNSKKIKVEQQLLIEKIFNRKPPQTLFHYTGQKGFIGIISSKEIWMTQIQYMNDKREFSYAMELVSKEVNQRKKKIYDEGRPTLRDEEKQNALVSLLFLEEGLREASRLYVVVSSFSEVGDSLSQWRAYGGESGFSIGFLGESLVALSKKEAGIFLGKCIYEKKAQEDLVNELINAALYECQIHLNGRGKDLQARLIQVCLKYIPFLKHPAFESEQEWRLIVTGSSLKDRLSFREGRSTIIPFYRKPLDMGSAKFLIKKVVVGPNPQPEMARQAALSFLRKELALKVKTPGTSIKKQQQEEAFQITVMASKIPYRNW